MIATQPSTAAPASPPNSGLPRFLSTSEVMSMLGYKNRSSFLAWTKRRAVPFVRLNPRKFVFEERALADWLSAHSNTTSAS